MEIEKWLKMYYDKDADLKILDGKIVGIIGYGSQGTRTGSKTSVTAA